MASALTIAAAYFLGGLVPLLPYLCVPSPSSSSGSDSQQQQQQQQQNLATALHASIAVMGAALFAFGYAKTAVVVGWQRGERRVRRALRGAAEMVFVGAAAAAAAMGLVKGFDSLLGNGSGGAGHG
ncbi:Ccc1 family [Lasiosphaeria miniovina]|uniref:Ccc1 family n=1 Tax=Lasiosphaeria miniovina TaxID=1954250 RepID=A0AA40DQH6_9PEZI|nr:Ccc1 family [Lasiosphaeria miniovina]KAK0709731.1 Ccc1 family [Lasiosphaeria miniovina]